MNNKLVENFVFKMNEATKEDDRELMDDVLHSVENLSEKEQKVEVLNHLLLIKGHYHHQEILRDLQGFADPSSVAYLEMALNQGLNHIDWYNGSGYAPIAKWFSHTLASIGTKEAIGLIEKLSKSENVEISAEMKYRLNRVST